MGKHIKTLLKEKEILPKDILDKVNSRKSKIPLNKKAEIILDKFHGKSYRQIGKEKNIAYKTAFKTVKDNEKIIQQLTTKQGEIGLEYEEKLIVRLLKLINKKIDRIENSENILDYTRLTELANTLKELFNKVQIQKGEPTSITKKYEHKDLKEIKEEVIETAKLLKDGKELELTKAVFKNK